MTDIIDKPLISVIVPVYNTEKHIRECIESVLSQTFSCWELILVDDGSVDGSGLICDEYARKDVRVKAFHQKNGGVSRARNLGINVASGRYVTFIDSDDYIDDTFFENAINLIRTSEADIYISGLWEELWHDGDIVNTQKHTCSVTKVYSVKSLLEANCHDYPLICISGPCCKLFEREILQKHSISFAAGMDRGEDSLFNIAVISKVKKIVFDNSCFYHYRRWSSESLFSRFCENLYEVFNIVFLANRTLLEQTACSCTAIDECNYRYCQEILSCIAHVYSHSSKTSAREKRDVIKKVARDSIWNSVAFSSFPFKQKLIIFLLKVRMFLLVEIVYYLKFAKPNAQKGKFVK